MADINVCFIHIEKAGGTTLNDFFLENLPAYWIMPPKKMEYGWRYDSEYLNRLRKFLRFRNIGGHQLAAFKHYEKVFANPLYVSFVRQPIDRFLSHVNWRSKQHVSADLDEFVTNERTLNQQCFRISGERNFAAAKALIESTRYFIGITELYDESLFILQRMLGLKDAPFESSNVTQSKHRKFCSEDLDPAQLARLSTANAEDVKLYQWVKSEHFENQKKCVNWSELDFNQFQQSVRTYHRRPVFGIGKRIKGGLARLTTNWIG